MAVKNLTGDNFEQEVIQEALPVLVDFWAPWCGPCKKVGPNVETLAAEKERHLVVAKVNVDENKNLAVQYGIRGIPTLVFFKDGAEVKRVVGAQNKSQLQTAINQIL